MGWIIDAPIIDHVFQPVSDRLEAVGLDHFKLARFFADGSLLTLLAGAAYTTWVDSRDWKVPWPWVAAIGLLMVMLGAAFRFVLWLMASFAERTNHRGLMNPARHDFLGPRLMGLGYLLSHVLGACMHPQGGNFIDLAGYAFWTISAYFICCTKRPAVPRRKAALAARVPRHRLSWLIANA